MYCFSGGWSKRTPISSFFPDIFNVPMRCQQRAGGASLSQPYGGPKKRTRPSQGRWISLSILGLTGFPRFKAANDWWLPLKRSPLLEVQIGVWPFDPSILRSARLRPLPRGVPCERTTTSIQRKRKADRIPKTPQGLGFKGKLVSCC